MDINVLTIFLTGLTGLIAGVVGAWVSLRRLPIERTTAEANAAKTMAAAAHDMITSLRAEVDRLEIKVEGLEKRDRTHIHQIETLRNDLLDATRRIRNLEDENQKLRQVNHELVNRLVEETEKRQALEAKLDKLIKNGGGGGGSV